MRRKLPVFIILVLFTVVSFASFASASTPDADLREFSNEACPTGTAKYAVDITNPGTASDTYTVEVNEDWGTVAPQTIEIDGGATDTAFIWLQPPADMRPGTYSFTVDIRSSATGETQTVAGTLHVLSCRAVQLSVDEPEQTTCLGDEVIYEVQVENTGEAEETYDLSASAGSLSHNQVTLAPGASTTVELAAYSSQPASETLTVSAESTTSYARDAVDVEFTAEQCRDVDVFISPSQESVCQGETGEFTITVQNTGSVEDTYDLSTNVQGASVSGITLEPGASETFKVEVTEGVGVHTIQARAQSRGFGGLQQTQNADLTVENCYDVSIITEGNNTLQIGQEDRTLMTFALENIGTRSNTYDMVLDGPEWVDLRPTERTLEPGQRAPAYLYAAPDFFAEEGTYQSTITVTDESGTVERVLEITLLVGEEQIIAEPNGQDEVDPGLTGDLISRGTGLGIIILVLAALFVGGYWLFRRQWTYDEVQEPRGDSYVEPTGPATMTGHLTGEDATERDTKLGSGLMGPSDSDDDDSDYQNGDDGDNGDNGRKSGSLTDAASFDSVTREREHDYYKSANDFLAQNRNTVRKALREDDFSKRFLEVLLEEERQDKNRTSVINEIQHQFDKKERNADQDEQ